MHWTLLRGNIHSVLLVLNVRNCRSDLDVYRRYMMLLLLGLLLNHSLVRSAMLRGKQLDEYVIFMLLN